MRLLEYLRPELQQSPEVRAILEAWQQGVDRAGAAVNDALAQMDVNTATWGLDLWEEALGIPVEAEKELAYRRTRVVAKLRGVGTTTAETIRNVAASFSYGEVEVAELPSEYRVTVRFVGMLGLPPNLDDLKAAIGEVIPAHLEIVYITDLKVWNDVKDKTWGEMSTLTWEQMRGGGV